MDGTQDATQHRSMEGQSVTRSFEAGGAKSWLAPLIALGCVFAMLLAPTAGAQAPAATAQANDPKPGAATPSGAPVEPAPAAEAKAPVAPPTGIEEIVVRGTESEAASDFEASDSVTAFGAEDLAALGASNIADLAAFTPNLEIVTAGATTPTFFIRGVGLNDFNSNSTGAVAIYQDDVPINAPALQLSTLYDISDVNVLRGPQGTGLARNASAGAIKIYSRKPTGEFGGYLRSEFGNYNAEDYEGAIEAPIYEDLVAGRLAFRFTQRDGTMQNGCGNAPPMSERVGVPDDSTLTALGLTNTAAPWSICGEPVTRDFFSNPTGVSDIPTGLASSVNNLHNWAARGTLLFQPTLDMNWLVNFHGSRRDELSRLGQSIGTRGFYCKNGDIDNCGFIGQTNSDAFVLGNLGGVQGLTGTGYRPREIIQRLNELAPCTVGFPGRPFGNCALSQEGLASENAAKIKLANELANNLDSNPWHGDFNRTGPTKNDTWGGYLKGEIALPAGMSLTTITGYDTYDRKIDVDLDQSPETLFQIKTKDDGWQATSGLQLQGQLGDESPVKWDIGGWILHERLNVRVENELGDVAIFGVGARDYTQELTSSAGYVSASYDFWDNFTLDGGIRYNWEQKQLDYTLQQGSIPTPFTQNLNEAWDSPTGTIRLTYRFREDTHAYWKYTHGWKPGTYNATSSLSEGVSVAKPEKIDAFETGLRGSWLDGRAALDMSLFYYNYQDYQLFTAQQFAGGQPEFVILNANNAEVYGAELDAVARPWPGAFANVRFGWLESQFLDFVQVQQDIIVVGGQQVVVNRVLQNTGNPLPNSPRFKVSLTGEQSLPIGHWGSLTARYDGVWTDTIYYDAAKGLGIPNLDNVHFLPRNTIAQGPFWLHNVRLAYRPPNGQLEIAGWVRNVTNEGYKTFAFDASTFNKTSIYYVGDPRTYGVTLTVTF